MSEKRPIDRIRASYKGRRRPIEMEDWDLTLYFGPLTTADMEAVEERMRDELGEEPEKHRHTKNLLLLIHKAELEDGSRAFTFGDMHYLKTEADYTKIQRLVAHMYSSSLGPLDPESAKKKSEKTEDSGSG